MNGIDTAKVEWIKANIKDGMTVVDIGACVGLFTEILSDIVGESGRVIAFEPKKENFDTLCEVMKDKSNTILEHAGISDSNTDGILYCVGPKGWNSFYKEAPYIVNGVAIEDVKLWQLDSYLAEKGITTVALIKLDVEGYDLQVLQGAYKTLSNSKKIALVMEVHCYKNTKEEIFNFLTTNSFSIYEVISNKKITDFNQLPEEIIALKGF